MFVLKNICQLKIPTRHKCQIRMSTKESQLIDSYLHLSWFSTPLSFNLSMFHPPVLPLNSSTPPIFAAVVSQKQKRWGEKKKTETETREKRWQTRAPQWHRASRRTMSPFKRKTCIWSEQAAAWQFNVPRSKNSQNYSAARIREHGRYD